MAYRAGVESFVEATDGSLVRSQIWALRWTNTLLTRWSQEAGCHLASPIRICTLWLVDSFKSGTILQARDFVGSMTQQGPYSYSYS